MDRAEHTKMKHFIILLLVLALTSCGGWSLKVDFPEDNELAGNSTPNYVSVHYKFKKMEYNYEPWPYTSEHVCGWVYDEWMNDYDGMNVCVYTCREQERHEHREWFHPTYERCMFYDYKKMR